MRILYTFVFNAILNLSICKGRVQFKFEKWNITMVPDLMLEETVNIVNCMSTVEYCLLNFDIKL